MKLEIGQVVQNFAVERVLGSGGTAVVYLVRDRAADTYHALKVLTVSSPAIRERMRREGEVQSALRHPNIVPVRDVIDLDGSPALVMEFVEGPTLDAALRRYRLTLTDAELLFGGILAGVHAAHASGLVHRDLKPANVLLASTVEGFVPKVTDFGLAKIMVDIPGLAHTRQGISMGTPSYMAPEQIRDAGSVDRRADLWSLGCLLYELMTRRRAFPGDEALAIYNAVVDGAFAPPREWMPDLPDRVNDAILGCMQLDPARRIPDCETLLQVLQGHQGWDVRTRAWSDEESTEDPLLAGLPAQFASEGGGLETSIGAELELESPGVPTEPVLTVGEGGLDTGGLITDDDLIPPVGLVGARTTGADRQLSAIFDDEAPTVAVRLTERVPSGELPLLGVRRPRPTLDSIGADSLGSGRARTGIILMLSAAAVLFTTVVLGASASVIGVMMSSEADGPVAALVDQGTATPDAAVTVPTSTAERAPPTVPAPRKPEPMAGRAVERPAPVPVSRPEPPRVITAMPPEAPPEPAQPAATVRAAGPPVDVRITSLPFGAVLIIDGESLGRTPRKVPLTPGRHAVVMESDGERGSPFSIDIAADGQSVFCYKFANDRHYSGRCPQ